MFDRSICQLGQVGIVLYKCKNRRQKIYSRHWIYVDDLTVALAVDLREKLTNDDYNTLEEPVPYHSRTNQILPPESYQYVDIYEADFYNR